MVLPESMCADIPMFRILEKLVENMNRPCQGNALVAVIQKDVNSRRIVHSIKFNINISQL